MSKIFTVNGLAFDINTDDWANATDAERCLDLVETALFDLGKSDPTALATAHRNLVDGIENAELIRIAATAWKAVTADYAGEVAGGHNLDIAAA